MFQEVAVVRRIVIVGYGNIGHRHLVNCRSLFPEADIYVVSSSGRELEFTDAAVFQINLSEAVKLHPDFAIVASPSSFHHQHSMPFIEAGVPVLLEKPVSDCIEHAEDLLQQAQNTLVSVGYCLRYLPAFSVVNRILTEMKLGRVLHIYAHVGQYLPDWRKFTEYQHSVTASAALGGGVLLELSHEFDYLHTLFGELHAVSCTTKIVPELSTEVELQADMLLRTEDGVSCFVHMDAVQKTDQRFCCVVGSDASLRWDLKKNTVIISGPEGETLIYSDSSYDRNIMYLNMLNDFVHRIQTKKPAAVSLAAAVEVVKLIERLKQLAKEAI